MSIGLVSCSNETELNDTPEINSEIETDDLPVEETQDANELANNYADIIDCIQKSTMEFPITNSLNVH